jgi:hypothetical protein
MSVAPRRQAALLFLVLASGCAVRPIVPPDEPETRSQAVERRSQAARPAYNLAGYPPSARDGYIDGCESAKHSSYARRDAKRMAADAQYEMGWNDGFSICKR